MGCGGASSPAGHVKQHDLMSVVSSAPFHRCVLVRVPDGVDAGMHQEENMVAKTIGFNWGPAGTSCGVWTGVRLADVLRHCGMRSAAQGASHVCFRGPEGELPQGAPECFARVFLYLYSRPVAQRNIPSMVAAPHTHQYPVGQLPGCVAGWQIVAVEVACGAFIAAPVGNQISWLPA